MHKYIIILTIFFVHTLHSEAHDELKKHDLCSRALDYNGCIKNNSNYTMENFGEWGPDWEISGRDLAFGRGKGWGEGADMG